jgi:site-specific DNA recombinase
MTRAQPTKANSKTTEKTAIYCRTSVEHEDRIEQQKSDGIAFCKSNNVDFEIYSDEGVSGYKIDTDENDNISFLNKPELNRLISDIKSGEINQVWCKNLSRLARNDYQSAHLFNIFEKYKIIFFENNKKHDLNDPQYKLMRNLMSAVNQFDRDRIISNTQGGLKRLKNQGAKPFQSFYGYKKSGKNESGKTIWSPVQSELNVIKFAYSELLKSKSYKSILLSLHDRRLISPAEYKNLQRRLFQIVRHFEYTGYTWTTEGQQIYNKVLSGAISDILSLNNKNYFIKSTPYPEQLISIENWFKVFEKNIIRKRFTDGRKETKTKTASTGLATGLIECCCGFKFYSFSGKYSKTKSQTISNYNYYKHHPAYNSAHCNQKPRSFNSQNVDEIFKNFFFYHCIVFDNSIALIEETLFKIQQEITAKNDELKRLSETIFYNEKQIKKFNKIIDDTDDNYLLQFYPKKIIEAEEKNTLLKNEKKSLIIELEKLDIKYSGTEKNKMYTNLKELVLNWFNFTDEEKRTHLIKFINKCCAFSNFIIIDAGETIYLFDAKSKNTFDTELLENLEKDYLLKEHFINWSEKLDESVRKQKNKMLIVKVNLKSKTVVEKTADYLKNLNINYDLSNAKTLIDFTSRRALYQINKASEK